ncbi:nuclear transport factor 2 family protein [Laspinema sp. D1]|uniref:nuclear transport factor 2 family protein n=1 Tax=Laspinema palackyanum TaxID=3231601 RepID=UPI00347F3D78|nr:nuclear transport factor 2 family protein [Laspinema sp. D2b]
MTNPLSLLQSHFRPSRQSTGTPSREPSAIAALMLGFTLWCAGGATPTRVAAATAQTAPPELNRILQDIDAAANRQDIQAVMQFYSPTFVNSDGLDYQSLREGLTQLWQRYPNLSYRTEIESWERDGNGFKVETVTEITGVETQNDRNLRLTATVRSQQHYSNQQIVRQNILAERNQITTGENPPTLQINLPEEVRTGERYNFDAIVVEPLRNDLILGYAQEEPVRPTQYLIPSDLKLEPLSAGGLFKIGQAPSTEDNRWISAIIVRKDGITMVTHRLRIVAP